ncbi:RagB/SusD family nutrient uptake outer membrane protein [Zhouia sp. PK063]|uniref:RagB/SusD family nutrient uptake outer membrane protein n=1 Tax=Zhouia sp. PK063 TaxID=3373602 RepID=UPI00379D3195
MKRIKYYILPAILLSAGVISCTNLDEDFPDRLTKDEFIEATGGEGNVDVGGLLTSVYNSLRDLQSQDTYLVLQEHTGDALMGPTRGGDWDDNGQWRVLHQHTWDTESSLINGNFTSLTTKWYNANEILKFSPSSEQEAEARFLRAFFTFLINDNWGKVPYREPGAPLSELPTVMSSQEANDFVISELEAIVGNLPSTTTNNKASKNAAYTLLAKAYLNKAVYNSEDRMTFSFDNSDMQKVIDYTNMVINSGQYSLENYYWDNFTPDNGENGTELIFVSQNIGGQQSGNIRAHWYMGTHYNQPESGWNGFTTLAGFYDKFEENDIRRHGEYDNITETLGHNVGFLEGQQYGPGGPGVGPALKDRNGNPLAFTKESPIIAPPATLEISGIRTIKYVPDLVSGDNADNDYVIFRYADVLLMKAEALMRMGDNAQALIIVNNIRTNRGASTIATLNTDVMIDERGRELWLENWRRHDLIRFGKFLDAWDEKPASDPKYLLFPIPSSQIVANPNLTQNPGY